MRINAPFFRTTAFGLFFVSAVSLTASGSFAQTKVLKWETDFCTFSGTYDARKHTEAQLRNTMSLFIPTALGRRVDMNVWKYDDIAKLDIAAYDRQYEEDVRRLRELDIVKTPFWEKLRQDQLREMEQVYQLTRTTAVAYTKPEVINDYPTAEACKAKYAGPLIAGGEELVAAWREVNLASQKVNASPRHLQERFDRENASPDRLKYALVETMGFGWWNCAIALIERPKQTNSDQADKEFKKLFRRVKEDCEDS